MGAPLRDRCAVREIAYRLGCDANSGTSVWAGLEADETARCWLSRAQRGAAGRCRYPRRLGPPAPLALAGRRAGARRRPRTAPGRRLEAPWTGDPPRPGPPA